MNVNLKRRLEAVEKSLGIGRLMPILFFTIVCPRRGPLKALGWKVPADGRDHEFYRESGESCEALQSRVAAFARTLDTPGAVICHGIYEAESMV